MSAVTRAASLPSCRATWVDAAGDLGVAEEDLHRLNAAARGATLFTSADWLASARCLVQPDRTAHAVILRDGPALLGYLPVTSGIERLHGIPTRTLRLLGDPLSDRVGLLVVDRDPRLLHGLLNGLLAGPRSWDVGLFSELAEDEWTRDAIESWAVRAGLDLHWRQSTRTPVLSLAGHTPDTLRASYSKSLRVRLARSRKKLHGAGHVSFERGCPSPDEIDGWLQRCKAIEDVSWKGRRKIGIFSDGPRWSFVRTLSRRLAARGMVDIGLLSLDGRPISYRYGFRVDSRFLDYNLAYDAAYAHLSPGRVLLDDMILSSLEHGLAAFDGSHGNADSGHPLEEWTETYVRHDQLWICARNARGRLLHALRERIRPGWRLMTQWPRRARHAAT